MAKYIADIVMDEGLSVIRTQCTRVTICNAQPTTYAEGMTTYALGTLAAASGNYTIGNGDSSGRKITYGAGTFVVGTTGTVSHVAWITPTSSGTVIAVGTCAPTAVTAGGTVITNAVDITEISDVT